MRALHEPTGERSISTPLPVTLPTRAPYDYTGIGGDVAERLRLRAADIRGRVRSTTATIIEIGKLLVAAKADLEHGQFIDWVETECGFSISTAENYIRATTFVDGLPEPQVATVTILPPATVYRLSRKSMPAACVEAVLSRAGSGQVVADRDVAEMCREVVFARREAERAKSARQRAASSARRHRDRDAAEKRAKEAEAADAAKAAATAQEIVDRLGADAARWVASALDAWRVRLALAKLVRGDAS